jgi:hypothetical protein
VRRIDLVDAQVRGVQAPDTHVHIKFLAYKMQTLIIFALFTLAYKIPHIFIPLVASHIGTMPPCESTIGCIDLIPFDTDEEHSSPLDARGSVIDLTGSHWEHDHALEEEQTHVTMLEDLLVASSTDELDKMQKDNL